MTETSPQRARTREELLEAARRVIARKGLLAATIVDIAEEAERAPATLYLYFASKLDLAYELARQFDSEAAHPATESGERSGNEVWENIAMTVGQFWQTFSDQLPVAVGAFQLAMVEPGFAAEWADIRRAVTQRFTRAIQRLQERGISPKFDPVPVASAISGMLFHSAIVAQFFGCDRDDEAMLRALTEIWYRGVTQFDSGGATETPIRHPPARTEPVPASRPRPSPHRQRRDG